MYRYWALTASPEIADVAVDSPQSGHVRISVLSRLNDGTASSSLIDAVKAVVMRDDIRVLTDTVHVLPAEIVPVAVTARVWLLPDTVQQILDAMPGYVAAEFSSSAGLGWDCTRSWLISRAASHVATCMWRASIGWSFWNRQRTWPANRGRLCGSPVAPSNTLDGIVDEKRIKIFVEVQDILRIFNELNFQPVDYKDTANRA